MTTPARPACLITCLLAASFALLSFASGCSAPLAQPSHFPHSRDFALPTHERAAALETRQATQTPGAARAFERAEHSPASPRAKLGGRRGDF